MGFKIIGAKREGDIFMYYIKGSENWELPDLLPYMLEVSKRSEDYTLDYDRRNNTPSSITDKKMTHRTARISLETTISKGTMKLIISDTGIGKQMVEKFARSVEDPEIILKVNKLTTHK